MKKLWNWKDVDLAESLKSELLAKFEISLYETQLVLDPKNVEILAALGDLYAGRGLLQKGLEIDQKLVEIRPKDPKSHYNLACSHSLLGQIDPAFKALSHALQLGYKEVDHLRRDPDLENLKRDQRYDEILQSLQGRKLKG